MANQIITIQLSLPAAAKSPVNTGDRRTTSINLAKQIRQGLVGGLDPYMSGAGSYLQVQTGVVAATGTITAATVVNANTASIAGTALTATRRRAFGTVTAATAIAGDTVTINGQIFTGTAGAVTPGDATFSIDTGNTETATSLAAQVNAYGGSLVKGIVAAKSAAAVVTLYAVTQGTAGNAITLASSDGATLAVSGATFSGGAAITNNTFDFGGTNETTAAALAAAINASTTAAVQQVVATVSGAIVTVTAKVGGLAGNTIALASSGATLAVSAATLTGGTASAVTRWTF
jgi:hypothetical protein